MRRLACFLEKREHDNDTTTGSCNIKGTPFYTPSRWTHLPEFTFEMSNMRFADSLKAKGGDSFYDPCQRRP
jgi:hypothetical protein